MLSRATAIYHPFFAYHMRPSVETSQQTLLNIYAPTSATAEWVPGQGMADATQLLVWSGYGRMQPDKDWRARAREMGNEYTATQAVRIQIGIGKNLHGAELDDDGKVITYGPDPVFKKDFVVKVVSSPVTGTEGMIGIPFVVRNALSGSTPWLYNLLCDGSTK